MQVKICEVAEAFSQQRAAWSPLWQVGRMHVSCCGDSSAAELELAVGCRRLNPSNCSRPQSISSARAESCTCFSKCWALAEALNSIPVSYLLVDRWYLGWGVNSFLRRPARAEIVSLFHCSRGLFIFSPSWGNKNVISHETLGVPAQ